MEQLWERTNVDLGTVKENSKTKFSYKYLGEPGLEIDKIEKSCGCTNPEFDSIGGYLKATFKAGKVPTHLKTQGFYITTKKITLYTSKGEFVFTFKAKVIK